MKRRSRAPGKMELLSLPTEILHTILRDICQSDYPAFIRAKTVCKGLQEVAESDEFLKDVDVVAMIPVTPTDVAAAKFKKVCLLKGNASAIFAKGASDFFKFGQLDEGLEGFRLAAEKGYELAVYVYALLDLILHWEQESRSPLTQLPRKFFQMMERKVRSLEEVKCPVFDKHPSIYNEKADIFEYDDLYFCISCNYASLTYDPEIDFWAGPCDKCFMIESIMYFRVVFPWKVRPWVTDEDLPAEQSVYHVCRNCK